jgi:hypothetical protein
VKSLLVIIAALLGAAQIAAARQASVAAADSLPRKVPPNLPAPTDCDAQLAKIAIVQPLGELTAPGGCGAADAVLLESVILPDGAKVAIVPAATLRCTMAQAVAGWVRDDVAPAAAKLGAPLRELDNLDSYECRGRNRVPGAKLSEHGRANALDVRAFKLANRETLVLVDPQVSKRFRDALRTSACARFSTVLGPGSDAEHAEHIHVDLEERRNNYKICEWNVMTPGALPPAAALVAADQVPLPPPRPVVGRAKWTLRR